MNLTGTAMFIYLFFQSLICYQDIFLGVRLLYTSLSSCQEFSGIQSLYSSYAGKTSLNLTLMLLVANLAITK